MRRSYTTLNIPSVMLGADSSEKCEIAGSITSSFSGNAFSVRIGRGKLVLPLGHPVSLQKPRMCETNAVI